MEQGDPPHRVKKRNININVPIIDPTELTSEYWKNAPLVLNSLVASTTVEIIQRNMAKIEITG
jgi:hypothetical protein